MQWMLQQPYRSTAMLSEDMDPSTINKDTFVVMQRTTPESGVYRSLELDGTVTYSGRTATFYIKGEVLSEPDIWQCLQR